MKIEVRRLTTTAKLPQRGSDQAAGYDLFADIRSELVIKPHTTQMVGTGLSIAVPEGYYGAIMARSGMSARRGLRPANCVGVCDSDYRGEYIVALHNDSDKSQTIIPQERIAQLLILPYQTAEFTEVDELDNTKRGAGGFGSTGA